MSNDEPGRGKKQCLACKKYSGVRTSVCACGHTFGTPVIAKPAVQVAAPILDVASKVETLMEVTVQDAKLTPEVGRTVKFGTISNTRDDKSLSSVPNDGEGQIPPDQPVEVQKIVKATEVSILPAVRVDGTNAEKIKIYAPAGDCPVKPNGWRADSKQHWPAGPASDADIQNWAVAVYDAGNTPYEEYHPNAIRYFIRYFWAYSGDEYERVKDLSYKALLQYRGVRN